MLSKSKSGCNGGESKDPGVPGDKRLKFLVVGLSSPLLVVGGGLDDCL